MAKRSRTSSVGGDSSKKTCRQVSISTFKHWQTQYEREYQSLSWLRCQVEETDSSLVKSLTCLLCTKYESAICGLKNFSNAWIIGSKNQRCSNVLDHAKSEQHKVAMNRYRVDKAKASQMSITSYSTIAKSILKMNRALKEKMTKKFEICYAMAKEKIAFRKYPTLHDLEAHHGVDLGTSYKTKDSAKNFTHYIAMAQRQQFFQSLQEINFFSFVVDGSTDAGRIEDEIVMMMFCKRNEEAEEINSCVRYLSIEVPGRADANGLIKCVGNALKFVGIEDVLDKTKVLGVEEKPIIVGGGTDGAAVNVSEHSGMKGIMQRALPWLFWAWCYAHRLELACKDSFSSILFKEIQEVLLRLYYLYEKSPKKSRELVDIVTDLQETFGFPKGGDLPIRSQGSRWITHRRNALQRVIDRFGAYISHIITLAEDSTMKAEDRARMKGYISKWSHAKILIGCSLYIDVLQPASLLSLTLQGHKLDIVLGIKHIVKTVKSLKKLCEKEPSTWPTYKLICSRIKDESGKKLYQGVVLKNYSPEVLEQCQHQALRDLKLLEQNMRERLEWSDVKLMRNILIFIDTQGWQKKASLGSSTSNASESESDHADDDGLTEITSALDNIISVFREPLQAKGCNLSSIVDEIEEIVEYARKYLNISKEGYQKIWYKLFTAPDSGRWANILLICELIFSLPFSNGHIERTFSALKLIKTDRRTSLNTSTLSDLLDITVEGPELKDFSAEQAVDLWWNDTTSRRPKQSTRKQYKVQKCSTSKEADITSESDDDDSFALTLDDWDNWFKGDTDSDSSDVE